MQIDFEIDGKPVQYFREPLLGTSELRTPDGPLEIDSPLSLGTHFSFKLKKELAPRVKRCAQAGGYSSVQEFIDHVLEKELSKIEESESDEEIARKLKGLGYLD